MEVEVTTKFLGRRRRALRKKPIPKSKKAGLEFPVGRIARYIKKRRYAKRLAASAPVYMAAMLEYLASEVLDLVGNAAKDNNRKRIVPRHLLLAIKYDDELAKLLNDVTIAGGGVKPTSLLPKKTSVSSEDNEAE